jgi:DNA-binding LytR/AlgR family response regulator
MNTVTILIVEDEALVAEGLSSCLMQAGYKTTMATSGKAAMDSVISDPPDLIIMDIHLEGDKDGIETAVAIRKQHTAPIIFLTDYDDPETVTRAALAKPSNYLLKPFNERQILLSIQQALYNTSNDLPAKIDDPYEPEEESYMLNDCLFIRKKSDSSFKKVSLDKILYLEAGRAYCDIYTKDMKYTQANSMNKVHEKINHPSFIQVHRSHVVNLNQVEEIKGNVLVIGKQEIPIGDSFKEDVMRRFSLV